MKLRKMLAVLLAAVLLVGAWAGAAPARADYDMPYYIEVDISSQIVTIYDAQTRQIVRQMQQEIREVYNFDKLEEFWTTQYRKNIETFGTGEWGDPNPNH